LYHTKKEKTLSFFSGRAFLSILKQLCLHEKEPKRFNPKQGSWKKGEMLAELLKREVLL